MVTKLAVTDVIKSLNEVESRFNLIREIDLQFFPEWFENLPELTGEETAMLDRVRQIHAYHRADGPLTEGTVNLLILSPLLYLAGFCEPPFKMSTNFSLLEVPDNGLYRVLRVMKRIGEQIISEV